MFELGDYKLYHGDCRDILPEIRDIDTIITDPPQGLEFMGEDWDREVPGPEYWQLIRQSCKPGAMLVAFGARRTFHHLMVALEEGGWEIKDTLMWIYASGMPKNHNISKAIDEEAGAVREVIGVKPGHEEFANRKTKGHLTKKHEGYQRPWQEGEDAMNYHLQTAPVTDDAIAFDGWGTALRPAWEPIILAMNPLDGTYANNARVHGVAGLHIDACRIPLGPDGEQIRTMNRSAHKSFGGYKGDGEVPILDNAGRWPTDAIFQHSEDCFQIGTESIIPKEGVRSPVNEQSDGNIVFSQKPPGYVKISYTEEDGKETVEKWACQANCPVAMLNEMAGDRPVGYIPSGQKRAKTLGKGGYGDGFPDTVAESYGDSGAASRFFYCPKASPKERSMDGKVENKHNTVKPIALMRWLAKLTSTPSGGRVLDPFSGSGSTLLACVDEERPCIAIEEKEKHFNTGVARFKITYNRQVELL